MKGLHSHTRARWLHTPFGLSLVARRADGGRVLAVISPAAAGLYRWKILHTGGAGGETSSIYAAQRIVRRALREVQP